METLVALLFSSAAGEVILRSPKLGVFARQLALGDLVRPGSPIGVLRVLHRRYLVVAPEGAFGEIKAVDASPALAVGYGEPLLTLGSASAGVSAVAPISGASKGSTASTGDLALRAPIHGIFYRRASPEAPAYVEAGARIVRGQTVGLIEVMKTFNPVVYEGAGLPAVAIVLEIRAGERQEVSAGAVLLTLRNAE